MQAGELANVIGLAAHPSSEVARKAFIDLTAHSIQVFKNLQDRLEKGETDSEETQSSVRVIISVSFQQHGSLS